MMKACEHKIEGEIETHPLKPFIPNNAKLLMLGTFPPTKSRWTMDFYYPNIFNDMWRIFGIAFEGDANYFMLAKEKKVNLPLLIDFLTDKGIAIFDTATRVHRKSGTASDADLEIVEETDLAALLREIRLCEVVVTTGVLATEIFVNQFNIDVPKMGRFTDFSFEGRNIRLYRMPSSSRAYPLALDRKAGYYKRVFNKIFT